MIAATMLTVHHLGRSQSERIVWLCEELGLDYDHAIDLWNALRPSGTSSSKPRIAADSALP